MVLDGSVEEHISSTLPPPPTDRLIRIVVIPLSGLRAPNY